MQKFGNKSSQAEFKTTANLTEKPATDYWNIFFVYFNIIFKSFFIFKHSNITP